MPKLGRVPFAAIWIAWVAVESSVLGKMVECKFGWPRGFVQLAQKNMKALSAVAL